MPLYLKAPIIIAFGGLFNWYPHEVPLDIESPCAQLRHWHYWTCFGYELLPTRNRHSLLSCLVSSYPLSSCHLQPSPSKTDGQSSEDIEVSDGVVIEKRIDPESKTDGRSGESPAVVLQKPGNSVREDTTAILSRSVVRVSRKDVRSRTALEMYYLGMQQLTGMDSILYYAPIFFQNAGIRSQKSSFLASGVISIVIVVVTIPATLLADSWSRRMQTMVGGRLIPACLFPNAILYASGAVYQDSGAARWVVIVTIYAYVISYCVTWAMSVRSYPSEIQPPATRATATSLAQSANWVSR